MNGFLPLIFDATYSLPALLYFVVLMSAIAAMTFVAVIKETRKVMISYLAPTGRGNAPDEVRKSQKD